MSAPDKIAKLGGGVKDLAIGIGIVAAVAGIVYVAVKGKKAVDDATDAVKKGIGYVFGIDSLNPNASIGTDLFNATHAEPSSFDEPQAIKSCQAILDRNGRVIGPICQQLLRQGKLVKKIPKDFVQGYGVD